MPSTTAYLSELQHLAQIPQALADEEAAREVEHQTTMGYLEQRLQSARQMTTTVRKTVKSLHAQVSNDLAQVGFSPLDELVDGPPPDENLDLDSPEALWRTQSGDLAADQIQSKATFIKTKLGELVQTREQLRIAHLQQQEQHQAEMVRQAMLQRQAEQKRRDMRMWAIAVAAVIILPLLLHVVYRPMASAAVLIAGAIYGLVMAFGRVHTGQRKWLVGQEPHVRLHMPPSAIVARFALGLSLAAIVAVDVGAFFIWVAVFGIAWRISNQAYIGRKATNHV